MHPKYFIYLNTATFCYKKQFILPPQRKVPHNSKIILTPIKNYCQQNHILFYLKFRILLLSGPSRTTLLVITLTHLTYTASHSTNSAACATWRSSINLFCSVSPSSHIRKKGCSLRHPFFPFFSFFFFPFLALKEAIKSWQLSRPFCYF